MSYSISWHRTPKTVHNLKTFECEEELYLDVNDEKIKEAKELHSGFCGDLNIDKKPFSYERTGLNITSNLCDMFSWAINDNPELNWKETIHGKKGEEVEPILRKALQKMKGNEIDARIYDSPNWGTYPNAVRFLTDLLAESLVYSDFYLSISC